MRQPIELEPSRYDRFGAATRALGLLASACLPAPSRTWASAFNI
jgi:hypothetical protein